MARTVLVTGISGFIAKHVALAFLEAGYDVRGTLRSMAKAEQVRATLGRQADPARVTFCQADLNADAGWDEAAAGVEVVAHVASPVPIALPRDPAQLIGPAVDGTMRVLRAAAAHGIPRFVHTSSVAAVSAGRRHGGAKPFTEDDWTDPDDPHVGAYARSKTLAERAARDFVASQAGSMHYASVNPGVVFGPVLDGDFSPSIEAVRRIVSGGLPGMPRLCFSVVDARDVARMHVLAAETGEPPGGRYLAVSGSLWFTQMAREIKNALGPAGRKVQTRQLPDFAIRLAGLFSPTVRSIVPDLGQQVAYDNSRTRAALGIEFIAPEDATVAAASSLVALGLGPR